MIDKVQKIREEVEMVVSRRLNLLNGDYFDLSEEVAGFTNEIMDIVDSLQEKPISEGSEFIEAEDALEEAAHEYADLRISYYETAFYAFKAGAKWQKAKDESTTEDLGEYINELSKQFPEVSFAKLSRIAVRVAKWQKEQIKRAMDLGEPPYLISVEQAYYRTLKLLEV